MLGQSIVGFLFALSFTLHATAQYTSSCLEDCATQALDDSVCDELSDLQCACSSQSDFQNLAYACVQQNCPDELESGLEEFNSVCTEYTTASSTSYETTYTETTDSVSSYSSISEDESSSYATNYTDATPTVSYNSTTPTYYSSSSSYTTISYPTIYASSVSKSSSSSSSTTPPAYGYGTSSTPVAPPVTSYTGAADRHAVLPVAFVKLMAVVVAMAML